MIARGIDLCQKQCGPCHGGMKSLPPEEIQAFLTQLPEWQQTTDGRRIRREWSVRDFATAVDFFKRVGELADGEDHHPDLHLTSYRQVAIELWTHAVCGLTENDFILAAKIEELPVDLKE